jgi:hypothetical protein
MKNERRLLHRAKGVDLAEKRQELNVEPFWLAKD